MFNIPRWKIVLVTVACLVAVLFFLPNLLGEKWAGGVSWLPSQTVNLGLDLQGGSHLLLEVKTDVAIQEYTASFSDMVRAELRKEKIGYTSLSSTQGVLNAVIRDPGEAARAMTVIRGLDPGLEISDAGNGQIRVRLGDVARQERARRIVDESVEIVRRRVDALGTREPAIQRQGENRIVVQVPGLRDPAQLREILSKTAKLYFRLVDEAATPGSVASASSEWLPMADMPGQKLAVRKQSILTGENLVDAQPGFQDGAPVVTFRFDTPGGRRFAEVTTQNVGKPFAIVLDGKIISAPVIREPITGGSGVISGRFTVQEAQNLSVLLRAGALPAPLTILEERTVGPGLGEDSIRAGTIASLVGLVLVVGFMLVVYGFFGFLADIALILNLLVMFAILSMFQATLTLPGIAGIVLTMGMAVDANVLIFERMREEARLGRSVMASVDAGYTNALSAILDSNITTLIAAAVLFSLGTGPVRGFAVTLTVGLLASMFTAIMVTRIMIVAWVRWRRPKNLPL
ncbi:MAG: protein translocase subunit SecD [Pseudomonadota bacterium]|nr:protein translocase subunit SecD [Pseudomonadota bacterium]